jgi:hypothetical protein
MALISIRTITRNEANIKLLLAARSSVQIKDRVQNMTVPHERTRALRWGWELLLELQLADSLTLHQRVQVDQLLRHYPSAWDIKRWAAIDDPSRLRNVLGIENENGERVKVPQEINRPLVNVEHYINAISEARLFFRTLLDAENLPLSIRRQVPFVLRHYPEPHNMSGIEWLISQTEMQK